MARKPRLIPRGLPWLEKVFDKIILKTPDGIVVRKVHSVESVTDEPTLIRFAASKGFVVTRIGSHYIIHRRSTVVQRLYATGRA